MMSRLVDAFLRGPSEDGCEHQVTSLQKTSLLPGLPCPEQTFT